MSKLSEAIEALEEANDARDEAIDTNPPLPDDAVRVVPAPAAPKVYFPGDTVPAGTVVVDNWGDVTWNRGHDRIAQPGAVLVELARPSSQEWQSIVDRASAERGA